jgi:hypothetical protein
MNTRRSLGRVFRNHAENQFAQLVCSRTSGLVEPYAASTMSNTALKPARCQRTTVSGWTMTSVCFHPDQTAAASPKKLYPEQ